ncbi:hypothetical protein NOCA1160003 [metagenome]|uniref:Uncharacterized protein n=1 Tax=metagenome TaxID=256318 RepID=A0A2P2C9K0_9ZZZZ
MSSTPRPPMRWRGSTAGSLATRSSRPPKTTGSTRPICSSGTALRRAFRTFLWDAGLSRSSPKGGSSRGAPPFVLHASGEAEPLRIGEPRAPDTDSDLLEIDGYDFFWAIDAPVRTLAPDDSMMLESLWATDVEAGEIFPLAGPPPGDVQRSVPGSDDAALIIDGYRGSDEAWRFHTSTDRGQTWQRTDVKASPRSAANPARRPGISLRHRTRGLPGPRPG